MTDFRPMAEALHKFAKVPAGFKRFGSVYVDNRIPMIESLPENRRDAKKLLVDAIHSSGYDEHAHPPAAVKDLDLNGLGFRETRLAIPMPWEHPGAISWRSGRLHAHRAGDVYMVHQDAHAPASGAKALLSVTHGLKDVLPAVVSRMTHPMAKPQVIIPDQVKKAEVATEEPSMLRRIAPMAAGAGVGSVLAAGGLVAARPALRAEFISKMRALRHGKLSTRSLENTSGIPDAVRQHAKAIAAQMRQQGIDPAKARVGISATGGTGKSVLGRALAEEIGMAYHAGDETVGKGGFGLHGFQLDKYFNKHPIQHGSVMEQTHLLNQLDPDQFDTIVHLEKPVDKIKEQIINRGRGAFQIEYTDYPKLQRGIRHAFDETAGQAHEVAPGVRVKFKGPEGFNAQQLLEAKARAAGIDTAGLDREQIVHSLAKGKRSTSKGDLAYLRKGRIAGQLGAIGTAGAAGAAGGRVLADRPTEPDHAASVS